MENKLIFKNSFWLTLSEVFTKGVSFVIFILLARHFGPEIYGQWAFALGFVGLFAILVDFGFTTLTIRELAKDKSKTSQYVDNILAMKLILGLIVLFLIFIVSQFLNENEQTLKLIYFLGLYVVVNNFATFFQSVFRAYEKMYYETICRGVQGIILLLLSVFFIANSASILTISYVYIFSAIIAFLLSLFFIRCYFEKFFLRVKWKICKEILKESWPFLFSGIFYMIYFKIDSVMLGLLSNMKEVGYYGAAYNLLIAVFIVFEIITMSFLPKMSYFYKTNNEKFKSLFKKFKLVLLSAAAFFAVFLFIFSGSLIFLFYSENYSISAVILKIFSFLVLFRFLSYAFGWFLTFADEQRKKLKILGVSALLNIILNYFLIIQYQALGAAISTLVTELFLLGAYYAASKNKLKLAYEK